MCNKFEIDWTSSKLPGPETLAWQTDGLTDRGMNEWTKKQTNEFAATPKFQISTYPCQAADQI